MLRSLRDWFKRKKIGTGLPYLRRSSEVGPSRFLKARFKDPRASDVFKLGMHRELGYRLYLPSGSSGRDSLPLIVMLHGCRQDSLSFAKGTRMNALAEEGRFAVLYPEQSKHANPLRCWNWFDSASLAVAWRASVICRPDQPCTEHRPPRYRS